MILNITSYPRSGNSFFTGTLLAFDPMWKVSGAPVQFKPLKSVYTDEAEPYGVKKVPFMNAGAEDRNPLHRIKDQTAVYVYKRHDHPDDYAGPRIYLVRNGFDVITSYSHHSLVHGRVAKNIAAGLDAGHGGAMQYSDEDLFEQMTYWARHSKWGYFVLHGVSHPLTVTTVRYEDMKKNPIHVVKEALREVGIAVTERTDMPPPDFKKLHKKYPWFYRRGEANAHKDELPDEIKSIFLEDEDNRKAMDLLGYE
ncbi:MAG: sulfotransferase domain-containing protein [Planctomycetota bacterium]|jgi:hypothetical protein